MTSAQLVVLVVVVVVLVAAAVLMFMRNRSKKLQERFGPEYDRAVRASGSRLKGEAELQKLEKRVGSYSIRPLSSADRDRFQQSWRSIQARFVDDPAGAFAQADDLLAEAMSARGYPMADFEQRAAEMSVDHGHVVENYRMGHAIALRQQQNQATTEELRQGMIHYRALFDELVGELEQPSARAARA